jgi:hypothetical protein
MLSFTNLHVKIDDVEYLSETLKKITSRLDSLLLRGAHYPRTPCPPTVPIVKKSGPRRDEHRGL